jgi:hypothetical protein
MDSKVALPWWLRETRNNNSPTEENTMKTLKSLGAAIALTFVFAFAAFADCVPPGEMSTPPCTAAQITPDDPAAPGETSTPPNTDDLFTISEAAVDLFLGALSIL